MPIGRVNQGIVPVFLNNYAITLNGATNPEECGKVISWGDHEDAFDWFPTRKQFIPEEGLLVKVYKLKSGL